MGSGAARIGGSAPSGPASLPRLVRGAGTVEALTVPRGIAQRWIARMPPAGSPLPHLSAAPCAAPAGLPNSPNWAPQTLTTTALHRPRPTTFMFTSKFAAGALLVASAPLASDLYYQPADGTTLERTGTLSFVVDLDDFEANMMGQTMDPEDMGGDMSDMSGEVELEFTVIDEVVKATRGRSLELVREFSEFLVDGEEPDEGDDEGPEKVKFTWNEESGEYDKKVLDEDADEEKEGMLPIFLEDMDLRMFLPEGDVEEGDTWNVPMGAQGMVGLFMPGVSVDGMGELILAKASEEEPQAGEMMRSFIAPIQEQLGDLEMLVTYAGETELDGAKVAQLDMAMELAIDLDLSDTIQEAIEASGEEVPPMDLTVNLSISASSEGPMFWSLDGKHMHQCSMEGEFEFEVQFDVLVEMEGMGELPFDGIAAWSGEFGIEHAVTVQ